MKLPIKRCWIYFIITICSSIALWAQDKQDLYVEWLSDSQAKDICNTCTNCRPGDMVFTVKTNIPCLTFDSNVIDLEVMYDDINSEFRFCHPPGRFVLTIASQGFISKNIQIDGKSAKYGLKVTSKVSSGEIFVRTHPDNALMDFGLKGLALQRTSQPMEMISGEYQVKITKEGYYPIDTLITVPSGGEKSTVDIYLRPRFATIKIDLTAGEESRFRVGPVINIDSMSIDTHDWLIDNKPLSFNDIDTIHYYKVYENGIVPMPAGEYNYNITSTEFRNYPGKIILTEGETTLLQRELKPVMGFITITDKGNAEGAKIFLNDEEIGVVPIEKHKMQIGDYVLRLEKDDYISVDDSYTVKVADSSETNYAIGMKKYVKYHFTSEPDSSEIYVNDLLVGVTPADVYLREGINNVVIKNGDYFDYHKVFDTGTLSASTSKDFHFLMETGIPLRIESEEEGLDITVKRGNRIMSSGKTTPADLYLPSGNYTLTLHEKKSLRYRGALNNRVENKTHKVPSYSSGTFTVLGADYFPGTADAKTKTNGVTDKLYGLMLKGYFGRFNILPGLSTSILRASVFKAGGDYKGEVIDAGITNDETYPGHTVALSCIFLNGEFRAGGSLGIKYFDACLLASYAYHPKFGKLLPFSHIDGHDMFFGIEISTRVSPFNINFKLGQEIFSGDYNFYSKDFEDNYLEKAFKISNFVFSVGFTLGNKPSKGNNMLRIWY